MRNFIWSGDVNTRKLFTVAWHKTCYPLKEGGLGIRYLSKINEADDLKLCWELSRSQLPWAQYLISRVIRGNKAISYHVYSSIWSSIKHKYGEILDNCQWKIGNGVNIKFWTDPWGGDPLVHTIHIHQHLHSLLQSTLNSYIYNFC